MAFPRTQKVAYYNGCCRLFSPNSNQLLSPQTLLLMRSILRWIGFRCKKVPLESPSSTRATTTAHSESAMNISTNATAALNSMTGEPQKDPPAIVQPPPSKNTMNHSSNATAALNAFQSTLGILGQTPIPGIGAVTAMLLQVIKGVQVRVSSRLSHYSDSKTNFICI